MAPKIVADLSQLHIFHYYEIMKFTTSQLTLSAFDSQSMLYHSVFDFKSIMIHNVLSWKVARITKMSFNEMALIMNYIIS